MIYYYFLEERWDIIMTNLGVLTALCTITILACGIDLGYGISESRKKGQYTHSNGLRMTVRKILLYLSFILMAFFIDAINPIFIYFWDLPNLPVISIVVTIYLLVTEFISIREHASKGERKKIRNTPEEVKNMLKEVREITEEFRKIKNDK